MSKTRPLGAALLLTVVTACGGGNTTAPDLGFLVQSSVAPPVTAAAGAVLPIAVKVLHKESGGGTTPVAGKVVTLTVTAGGGTVNGAASATVTSGADGSVTATWTLGTALGAQTLRGSVSSTEFLDFTISATPGAPAQLAITTQPSATAVGSVPLARQPAVQLQDALGNNVSQAGIVVTASVATGPGAVSGAATATTTAAGLATFTDLGVTGGSGQATVTLGFAATLGGQTRTAASSDIAVVPPPKLLITTTPTAALFSNVEFFQQPVIQLADGLGNEIHQAGIPVTVSLATGTGQLAVGLFAAPMAAPATAPPAITIQTDANGRAQFHDLNILGSGDHSLVFAAPGYAAVTSGTLSVADVPVPTAPNGLGDGAVFSGAAGSDTYVRFVVPPGTTDLSFDNYGGPGSVNLYVRQGDFPTLLDHATCPLNPSGPVQRCVFTGAAIIPGTWYLVTHGVTAYSNVRMQGAAYGPACAQTPLVVGVTVGPRTFAPTDCNVPFGPVHRYRLTSTSQQAVSFTTTATSFVDLLLKAPVAAGTRADLPAVGGTTLTFLLPAAPLDIEAFPISGAQTYTLTANASSPNVSGCGRREAFSGVNTTLTLSATDCPGISPGTFSNRILVVIGGGQSLTVSATPAPGTFTPRIRSMDGVIFSGAPGSVISTADGTPAQGATLSFTNPGAGSANYSFEITSVLPGQTGSYVLKIDATPAYLNVAPPAFARAGVRMP